jgi:hypothetical protein
MVMTTCAKSMISHGLLMKQILGQALMWCLRYCLVYHMLMDISHPRNSVVGLLIPRIAVLGFLYIKRFKLRFKASV